MTPKNTHTKEIVAAFDFDGTLTYRDSLLDFLLFSTGLLNVSKTLLISAPYIIGFPLHLTTRQCVKEKLLKNTLGGMPIEMAKLHGKNFAEQKIGPLLKPEALAKLQWHQNQGHRCILISASIELYLEPWARLTGFENVICSRLEIDNNGCITGKLQGINCRGPEKVRLLHALLGNRENYVLHAYGDSDGDQELLADADFAYYRKYE